MIETVVLNYLIDNLSVPAFMEVPEDKLQEFVTIEKVGSSKENHIKRATLAIRSYGPTLAKAARLNEELKTIIENIIELDSIVKVQLNSDYNNTDTSQKRYRYQAVFDFVYY